MRDLTKDLPRQLIKNTWLVTIFTYTPEDLENKKNLMITADLNDNLKKDLLVNLN